MKSKTSVAKSSNKSLSKSKSTPATDRGFGKINGDSTPETSQDDVEKIDEDENSLNALRKKYADEVIIMTKQEFNQVEEEYNKVR